MALRYVRMAIEEESPEEIGYGTIENNLAESSVADALLKDLKILDEPSLRDLSLLYTVHYGDAGLRKEILGLYGGESSGITIDDIIVTPGAAAALFMIHTSLLAKESHLVVQRPNYGTNIETPKAIGCDMTFVNLTFENNFQCTADDVMGAVRPNTRLVSITTPHNPSGKLQKNLVEALIPTFLASDVAGLAEHPRPTLVDALGTQRFILCDETYRDVPAGCSQRVMPPVAASLHPNVISVSSMSKAFGLPGVRIGWLISKNAALKKLLVAAKEQIFITNSVLDEEVARLYLVKRGEFVPGIWEKNNAHFEITKLWIEANADILEWVEPDQAACVCFPRFKASAHVDTDAFYRTLQSEFKTVVGAGHWFDMPDEFMRIGYGWPTTQQLRDGLAAVATCGRKCVKL